MEMNKEIRKKKNGIILLLVLLAAAVICSILLGAVKLSFAELMMILKGDAKTQAARIMLYVRLPRVIAAVFAGAALALSGAVIQVVLHNPLAGPSIIGVNAGTALSGYGIYGSFFNGCYCIFCGKKGWCF